MLFNSFTFLLFAPCALLGFALLHGRARRVWLLAASYFFYGWANPWYCFLLLASTLLDYAVARRLATCNVPRARRAWLCVSLCGNLGLLSVFKYLGFFARTGNEIARLVHLPAQFPVPDILLPIGISFFTFQTMAYTIDVYRRVVPAQRNLLTVALYVAYFPQLVAGPIERAGRLMGQLTHSTGPTTDDVLTGATRILWGLVKKVVFADWLAVYIAAIYGNPTKAATWDLALATYAFAFQIYLDFSAYSDIAIGLARVMGIHLQENFRWPYLSRNLSEFWQRWHISLSTWLRDYLYIPLGGSRRGTARTVINVVIVMFLGGLWHGADGKFIVWGLWLGLGLGIYQVYTTIRPQRVVAANTDLHLRHLPAVLLTFHFVLVSWVFFRAESLSQAYTILGRFLRPWGPPTSTLALEEGIRTTGIVVLAALMHLLRGTGLLDPVTRTRSPWMIGVFWGLLIVLIALGFAPIRERFIYFQF